MVRIKSASLLKKGFFFEKQRRFSGVGTVEKSKTNKISSINHNNSKKLFRNFKI